MHDTKAVEEGRGYLMGVKLLRDRLAEVCTGEYGQPNNILEWDKRVGSQCYPLLENPDPPRPELLVDMVTWWSSDGVRVAGEAYSSYAVLADTCVKQAIEIEPSLKAFLKVYAEFAAAAAELDQAMPRNADPRSGLRVARARCLRLRGDVGPSAQQEVLDRLRHAAADPSSSYTNSMPIPALARLLLAFRDTSPVRTARWLLRWARGGGGKPVPMSSGLRV